MLLAWSNMLKYCRVVPGVIVAIETVTARKSMLVHTIYCLRLISYRGILLNYSRMISLLHPLLRTKNRLLLPPKAKHSLPLPPRVKLPLPLQPTKRPLLPNLK